MTNYFTNDELRCKGKCECRQYNVSPGFREHLNVLREAFGKPMKVNSCCRCFKHNEAIGGHHKSLHVCDKSFHKTKGSCAIDIDVSNYSYEEINHLCSVALSTNWSYAVNYEKKFIHLDLRAYYTGLPSVIFSY